MYVCLSLESIVRRIFHAFCDVNYMQQLNESLLQVLSKNILIEIIEIVF